MSKRESYEAKTDEFLQPIVQEYGLEVYDVEFVKEASEWYLRIFIDKPEGVSIQDCERVSRAMSEILDREDYIEEAYIFEVSSPGLGRALKKDRHLEKSIGKDVDVKTYKPKDGKKEFHGMLESFDKETIKIKTEDEDIVFLKTEVALIRLAFDF